MMKRWTVILTCFLSLLGTENSIAFTGNDLLDKCAEAGRYVDGGEYADAGSINYCFGFIQSFVQTSIFTEGSTQPLYICFPFEDKFTLNQLVRILVKYLKEHPDQLHHQAVYLVANAFKESFPCSDEDAPK